MSADTLEEYLLLLDREQETYFDPRWEDLAAGRLSEADAAELRRADPEMFEACRPFDAAARTRLVTAVLEAGGEG